MNDTPAINDGADTSLRKTVSLLNKIEAKTGQSGSFSGLTDTQLRASPVPVIESGQYVFGGFYFSTSPGLVQVADSNPNRVVMLIYNDSVSTAKAYVQYGSLTLSTNFPPAYAVVLNPKDYYEIPFFTGSVRVLCEAGAKINVTEITRTNSSSLLVTPYI